MSIIKNLTRVCAANITRDQSTHTAADRKVALNKIKEAINTNSSDTALIAKIGEIANDVKTHGHFGWHGPQGSTFLKHTNTLLAQAKFLQKHQTNHQASPSGVREFGLYIVHAIQLTQNKFSDKKELNATKYFLDELKNNQTLSDTDLINLAKNLCDTIPNPSSFWSLGSYDNYFLIEMNKFIKEAQMLIDFHLQEIKEDLTEVINQNVQPTHFTLNNAASFFPQVKQPEAKSNQSETNEISIAHKF